MNVVGRVSSLISQGVYYFVSPFHPFGGAVDIIVVEQQDGTFRSTPWYVRFGKFQGVLKGSEKVVTITVNGADADFHMLLDNSGQAYFIREISPNKASKSDQNTNDSEFVGVSIGDSINNAQDDNNDTPTEEIELSDEYVSFSTDHVSEEDNHSEKYEFNSELSSQEISVQSTEFHSYGFEIESIEQIAKTDTSEAGIVFKTDTSEPEVVLVSVDGHIVTAPISSNDDNDIDNGHCDLRTEQTQDSSEFKESTGDSRNENPLEMSLPHDNAYIVEPQSSNTIYTNAYEIVFQEADSNEFGEEDGSITHENVVYIDDNVCKKDNIDVCKDISDIVLKDDSQCLSTQIESNFSSALLHNSSASQLQDLVDTKDKDDSHEDAIFPQSVCFKSEEGKESAQHSLKVHGNDLMIDETMIGVSIDENYAYVAKCDVKDKENDLSSKYEETENISNSTGKLSTEESKKLNDTSRGLNNLVGMGFEISLCGNLLSARMGVASACEVFDAHRVTEEVFKSSGASIIANENLIVRFKGTYWTWNKVAHIVLGMAAFGPEFPVDPKDSIPVSVEETIEITKNDDKLTPNPSGRGWGLWLIPFRKTKSLQASTSNPSTEDIVTDSYSGSQYPPEEQATTSKVQTNPPREQFRMNCPTNEEIASLNLQEGQNVVTFSFSTRVLGKQKVDAHIYLWKWNTKIVISDVDGTITKSDVLGQVMPLVGKDWTQSGVARLFSAIKENGYQILFLSARAIVQAYLTRNFLLNLKQDGKALPNGPIVISPDGLFPSLYREVIRRTPHEFKIACLEGACPRNSQLTSSLNPDLGTKGRFIEDNSTSKDVEIVDGLPNSSSEPLKPLDVKLFKDIRKLFPSDYNPFYAGFGNRDTDELSYRRIGIPRGKIFIINPKGEVAISNRNDSKSYTSLHMLVNDMFPPTSLVEEEDFNSWNYWKMPLPNIN